MQWQKKKSHDIGKKFQQVGETHFESRELWAELSVGILQGHSKHLIIYTRWQICSHFFLKFLSFLMPAFKQKKTEQAE